MPTPAGRRQPGVGSQPLRRSRARRTTASPALVPDDAACATKTARNPAAGECAARNTGGQERTVLPMTSVMGDP